MTEIEQNYSPHELRKILQTLKRKGEEFKAAILTAVIDLSSYDEEAMVVPGGSLHRFQKNGTILEYNTATGKTEIHFKNRLVYLEQNGAIEKYRMGEWRDDIYLIHDDLLRLKEKHEELKVRKELLDEIASFLPEGFKEKRDGSVKNYLDAVLEEDDDDAAIEAEFASNVSDLHNEEGDDSHKNS